MCKRYLTCLVHLLLTIILITACSPQVPDQHLVSYDEKEPVGIVIQNVAVLDVDTGERHLARDVFIEGETIKTIVEAGTEEIPAHSAIIDGTGKTLLPGLIDMHGHINLDTAPTWARRSPNHANHLQAYLYAGVTTVFDPGDASDEAFSRRQAVADKRLIGPAIYTTGPIITASDSHPISVVHELAPWWISWLIAGQVAEGVQTEEDINTLVDWLAEEKADAVKIVVDRIPLDSGRLKQAQVATFVARAKQHSLRVVAHIGTTQDAIDAAEGGVSAWVHGVYKERIPDKDIERLAAYGIPMVATIEVFDRYTRDGPIEPTKLERETVPKAVLDSFWPVPEDFEIGKLQQWRDMITQAMEARVDNVRRLHEAGVTILAGSDTQPGVFPGAGLHRELGNLIRAGFTPAQAIRAATSDAARFLTQSQSPPYGLVAAGKTADLLLVKGDPSADISALDHIDEVIKGGRIVIRAAIKN